MGRRGVVQLAAGAVARVDQALLLQFCKMCGIDRASRALRRHLAVPVQPEPAEVPPQLLGIGRTAALRVKVLDAQQHTPALRPDGKPREQRGKNIAQMHTPGRAGRKAARHSGISRTRFRSGSPAA